MVDVAQLTSWLSMQKAKPAYCNDSQPCSQHIMGGNHSPADIMAANVHPADIMTVNLAPAADIMAVNPTMRQ